VKAVFRDGLQDASNQTHVLNFPEARREPKRATQHKGIFTNIATWQSKGIRASVDRFFPSSASVGLVACYRTSRVLNSSLASTPWL